jgi:hypothetical protein
MLTISRTLEKPRHQLTLFESEHRLLGIGQTRYEIGLFMEELTTHFLPGLERHQTDSRCTYCPDLSIKIAGVRVYFECKGVGKSATAFIYEGRLIKDIDFAQHHTLYYVIWHHKTKTDHFTSIEGLRLGLIQNMHSMYLAPFSAIQEICSRLIPVALNTKYGHAQDRPDTYGKGYRFPISRLWDYRLLTFENDPPPKAGEVDKNC